MSEITVSARLADGVKLTRGGEPLILVALDAAGNQVAVGEDVSAAIVAAVVAAQENAWAGQGHLTAIERVV